MMSNYEAYPASSVDDLETIRHNERLHKKLYYERLKTISTRTLGVLAVGASVVFSYTQKDIQAGKEEVADSHSSLHLIYDSPDLNTDGIATVVATGLGTRDPSETAQILSSHEQMGNVFALEYSNEDINIDELTNTVVEGLKDSGTETVMFDGYSAGGPIELAIAAKIHKENPDINVAAVVLNSSPIGYRSISPESQRAGDMLSAVVNIYPDIVYSQRWRAVAELIARNDRYVDWGDFSIDISDMVDEAENVYETKVLDEEAASASLIASQYSFIKSYGVERNLEILSENYFEKPQPIIFYTRAIDSSSDSVVNIDKSRDNFNKFVEELGLSSEVLYLNAGHANPGERPSEYNNMFAMEIQPRIEEEIDGY